MTRSAADREALLARLDLPAKVRLLTGASSFTLAADERIGLRAIDLSDGPTGIRGVVFAGGVRASLLPNATLLASGWDVEAMREVGDLLAEEAQRQRVGVVLGPTINLHRSPLGGRLFEAFSEDPLLTGVLAAAYVEAMQARGTGACLKHWVANEAETERTSVDDVVEERTLREVYLLPFEIAVTAADPWMVMAAYNDVNGTAATEHGDLNHGVLKGEWGWPGVLVSDWYATRTAAASAGGGLDLVMPGPDGPWGGALVEAVRSGEVQEALVDDHVRRLLRLARRVGALGTDRAWPEDLPEPDGARRREQLTRLAARGMTVLRNDGVLPLALGHGDRLVLVGRHAHETVVLGGGSATVHPPHVVSIAEGAAARWPGRVETVDGVAVRSRPLAAGPGQVDDPDGGGPGVRLEVLAADGTTLRHERLAECQSVVGVDDDLPEDPALVRLTGRVGPGCLRVGVLGTGAWTVRIGEDEHRVRLDLGSGDPGEAVLRPPAWTMDVDLDEATVVVAESDVTRHATGRYGLAVADVPRPDEHLLAEAVAAATGAAVAVVVVGLSEEQETESVDKTTLVLPGRQDDLVRAVAAVATRTVVVVNAATPVLMPWSEAVDAVVWAGLPGQEAGHAVAAALAGDVEPAGRLVTTFPAADGASPAWSVTPTAGRLEYSEGRYVGYRGHAAGRVAAPAHWFGEGLGYGRWSYDDVEASHGADQAGARVSLRLTNTGEHESTEVVQVYLAPDEDDEPVRLAGWSRVTVAPGASTRVEVVCDARMWRAWDVASGSWHRLGRGELLLARGLGDVRARVRV